MCVSSLHSYAKDRTLQSSERVFEKDILRLDPKILETDERVRADHALLYVNWLSSTQEFDKDLSAKFQWDGAQSMTQCVRGSNMTR